MNDNMIERVARALCKESGGKAVYWENWIADATVAIQAMRKPTPAMIKSGFESISASCDINSSELLIAWQAMIDAALTKNNGKQPLPYLAGALQGCIETTKGSKNETS